MPMRFVSTSRAGLQIIDAGAAGLLVIVAQRHAAEADRLAGAGAVHDQHRNAALHQVGHAAQKLDFLRDVETVKEHDARRTRGLRVLGRHEIARQLFTLERHIDDLDLRSRQRDELVKALDRGAIGVERAFVLRRPKALAHLIVMTGAQIERRRRHRIILGAKFLGVAAHGVGDRCAGVKPRLVVVAALAFEHAADLVQFAHVDAAERRRAQHVHECRRPAVIAGEVHEVFRCILPSHIPLRRAADRIGDAAVGAA